MSRPQRWWHNYPGPFRPIWAVAQLTGINPRTIRSWIRRGKLTAACDIRTRELIAHAPEANTLTLKTDTPNRERS